MNFEGPIHKLYLDSGEELLAHTVIIATGAAAKWLGLPSEQRLNGSGVSACAVCDGFFYKGQELAIVGAGDTACEEALYLSNLSPMVHMIVRRDKMRASAVMQERVLKNPKIKVYWNSETMEILGDKLVEGVRIINNVTNEVTDIPVKGFLLQLGISRMPCHSKITLIQMSRDILKQFAVQPEPMWQGFSQPVMYRIKLTGRL